jgi:hypothetical protein
MEIGSAGWMKSPAFPRSTRSLSADGFRGSVVGLVLVAPLLVAWFAWFFLAQVELYEVAATGRLEVDALGTLAPPGKLKLVAEFPAAVLGRIQPGQPARLRLDGFPWMQDRSLSATVARVADEVQGGGVRVELIVRPEPAWPIPLQDGLHGTVEIEVERVSPATLVLRAVGLQIGR